MGGTNKSSHVHASDDSVTARAEYREEAMPVGPRNILIIFFAVLAGIFILASLLAACYGMDIEDTEGDELDAEPQSLLERLRRRRRRRRRGRRRPRQQNLPLEQRSQRSGTPEAYGLDNLWP